VRYEPEKEGCTDEGRYNTDWQGSAEGGRPSRKVGQGQKQGTNGSGRQDGPARMPASQLPSKDRGDQADKANRSANRDAGADAERSKTDNLQAEPQDVVS
jgi:hypothetical protein